MKAVIIEDEGIAARRLKKLIENRSIECIEILSSLEELRAFLSQDRAIDLYFMDIHLSDGIIFEIFETNPIEKPIIFTTAYDQYAIKAFKQNSIDYLLKPIQEEDLDNALEKYNKYHQKNTPLDLQQLSALIIQSNALDYKTRFSAKVGDRIKSIDIQDITHFYSESKINFLHTVDGRSYPIEYSMDKLFGLLSPDKFFKINRSQIVHILFIEEIISYSNSRLKLNIKSSKNEFVVAREKVKDFKQWLG